MCSMFFPFLKAIKCNFFTRFTFVLYLLLKWRSKKVTQQRNRDITQLLDCRLKCKLEHDYIWFMMVSFYCNRKRQSGHFVGLNIINWIAIWCALHMLPISISTSVTIQHQFHWFIRVICVANTVNRFIFKFYYKFHFNNFQLYVQLIFQWELVLLVLLLLLLFWLHSFHLFHHLDTLLHHQLSLSDTPLLQVEDIIWPYKHHFNQ